VPATEDELKDRIDRSQAATERLSVAKETVDGLDRAFQEHTRLAEKLLDGLDNYGVYLSTAFNDLRLAIAIIYAAIGGYVVVTGADYCDCTWLPWDRVAGVRRAIENALG
jgi:hypothetical protein